MTGYFGQNAASGVAVFPNNARASMSSNTNPSMKFHGLPATQPNDVAVSTGGDYNGPLSAVNIGGDPFALFLGIVLAIMIIKWAMERTSLPASYIHVGPLNFVIIALSAWVGAVGIRIILNLFPVPGLTQLANFAA